MVINYVFERYCSCSANFCVVLIATSCIMADSVVYPRSSDLSIFLPGVMGTCVHRLTLLLPDGQVCHKNK